MCKKSIQHTTNPDKEKLGPKMKTKIETDKNLIPYKDHTTIELSDEIWITKWIDYSSKYGIGYQTTDGSIGVSFNDDSKIVLHSNKQYYHFLLIEILNIYIEKYSTKETLFLFIR